MPTRHWTPLPPFVADDSRRSSFVTTLRVSIAWTLTSINLPHALSPQVTTTVTTMNCFPYSKPNTARSRYLRYLPRYGKYCFGIPRSTTADAQHGNYSIPKTVMDKMSSTNWSQNTHRAWICASRR